MSSSYGLGNSLYSSTECLTRQDTEYYFRILPTRPDSSTNKSTTTNSSEHKRVEYLRPTSFEHQQRESQQLNKNKVDIIPYTTFHESKLFFLF